MAAEKYAVSGDQFWEISRRWRAVQEQLDRGREGDSPLDPVLVANALQCISEGDFPRPDFKRDMRKESGWELMEDMRGEPVDIVVSNLELVTFLNHDEQCIMGEEMCRRAKNIGTNLGQRHAEYLLEHQEQIPEEFRKYYLMFPGTVWRDRFGTLGVPCLYWDGGRWYLYFHWLGYRFGSDDRLLRPRK